jgi:hypothetical protein
MFLCLFRSSGITPVAFRAETASSTLQAISFWPGGKQALLVETVVRWQRSGFSPSPRYEHELQGASKTKADANYVRPEAFRRL